MLRKENGAVPGRGCMEQNDLESIRQHKKTKEGHRKEKKGAEGAIVIVRETSMPKTKKLQRNEILKTYRE